MTYKVLQSKKRDRENEGDKRLLLHSSYGFLGIPINEERCEETQLQVLTYRLPETSRPCRGARRVVHCGASLQVRLVALACHFRLLYGDTGRSR